MPRLSSNIELSTSQWLGLATALAAGVALRRLPEKSEMELRDLEAAA